MHFEEQSFTRMNILREDWLEDMWIWNEQFSWRLLRGKEDRVTMMAKQKSQLASERVCRELIFIVTTKSS